MFKLKELRSPSEKQQAMLDIKRLLEKLPADIPFLRAIRVDFNVNPEESFDLILTSDVDNMDDLAAYAAHPAHLAISQGVIGPVKKDRACVDYEI
jgi:hypothetical protein